MVSQITFLGCTEGEIRLVGGNHTEGRVEICLSDVWGTVCDLMWNSTEAAVVCRQLGLASAGITPASVTDLGGGGSEPHQLLG